MPVVFMPILLLLNFQTKQQAEICITAAGVVEAKDHSEQRYFVEAGQYRLLFTGKDAVKMIKALSQLIEDNPI